MAMEQETKQFGKISDIQYVRPDMKALTRLVKATGAKIKKAKTYEEAKEAFFALEKEVIKADTMQTLSSVRNTLDKRDEFYENEEKVLAKEGASFSVSFIKLAKIILASPFVEDIRREYGDQLVRRLENQQSLMSSKILLLTVKESRLCQTYSRDAALCKTTFRGEECNFYGLLKHMESTDREERREAFEAWANLYESVSGKLDATYDKLVAIRCKIAKRMGFDSYIDYAYRRNGRLDYKQDAVAAFRESVRKYIVPLCQKLYDKQAKDLGVDKFHFYDEALTFPDGNANPIGTKDELVEKARLMYNEMSPESGEYFNFMCEHELFDLDTRPGKHLGGYCTFFPEYKAPYIFSNFNGTSADVDVLTHEAGHAFQGYLAVRNVPIPEMAMSTSEINEIHSMTMEHFAYPYMERFFGENTKKYLYHHLVRAIECIPYLVSVDEFQHRVFENPKMSAMERRAAWHKIEEIYLPWRDYDGNKFLEEGGFWMQKQHIFLYPFYYVDYALAQVCAFQLYLRDCENHEVAWADYVRLCKAGGTLGYFDLLKLANLENPFKEETIKKVADAIAKAIDEFDI